MKEKILIVEDQFVEANNLQMILERAGYEVCGIARSVPIALRKLEQTIPDIVLLDIFLQGNLNGIDLGKMLLQKRIPFVYLSANSNKETLEAAKATYPYGFLVKPFREPDVLVMLEIAQFRHRHLMGIGKSHQVHADSKAANGYYGIIGKSHALLTVLAQLQTVAPTDTSVLILGETGTGKERVAECIHELSPRKQQPLIKVNCAGLPATLIESALFGHEKGAFTSAIEKKTGKFEQADKGTILLDEIGELSIDVQSKLLRVLQEKELERIGSSKTIKIDVRIIAATNRDLEKEMAEGKFRMDLYYRLHVFPLMMPPLRERKEDIPLLARHFMQHFARITGKQINDISDEAIDTLISHKWPGNVRELQHVIERAVILTSGQTINNIPLNINSPASALKPIDENEKNYIIAILKKCNGKIFGKGGAAEIMGLHASTLNSKIKN